MFNTEDEILRRLQEKNLEMAVMFYHWCQRNHLTCYLCGGGCIGQSATAALFRGTMISTFSCRGKITRSS